MTGAFWASISLLGATREPLPRREPSARNCNEVKKAEWYFKTFQPKCRHKVCRCGETTSNTWDKHSHKYPAKPKLSSRFPVSFLYDPLEQRDHSNCLFTSLTQVGNKQQSRHARISWTVEIFFFFLAIPAFHSLILYFISSLFPAKPLKGNVVQQINKWPDSPGRINTVEDD